MGIATNRDTGDGHLTTGQTRCVVIGLGCTDRCCCLTNGQCPGGQRHVAVVAIGIAARHCIGIAARIGAAYAGAIARHHRCRVACIITQQSTGGKPCDRLRRTRIGRRETIAG